MIDLIQRYKNKGILVDTNILLLAVVGAVNRSRISKFKRTEQFTPEDYDLLIGILDNFSKVVTTPNIMTEVNSFLNQIGEPDRHKCILMLADFTNKLNEFYIESKEAAKFNNFGKLGLTDCGIINLAKDKYLVLTVDATLQNFLYSENVDVVNFNHIRF
ncbi:MAG: PIN domain-containing protein [Crinalium sp.]